MAAVTAPLIEYPTRRRPSTVSVVLVADSTSQWEAVDRALLSLGRQTRRPDQIVLVVDHDDELLESAADAWSGDGGGRVPVDVVANPGPVGLADARNAGLEWCDGEVVAFLGRDTEVADRFWIETLLDDYADADVAGAGGGAVVDTIDCRLPDWMPSELAWSVGCSAAGSPRDAADVEVLLGTNLSFRRDALVEIGGFRSVGGELDCCVRLRRRYPAARLVFDPDLDVRHRLRAEELAFSTFRHRCFEDARTSGRFARDHDPRGITAVPRALTAAVPRGMARSVFDGVRGHRDAFRRAGALAAGFAWAAAGYTRGRFAP